MKIILKDILSLIFPNLCTCCKNAITASQDWICSNCLYDLPKYNNSKDYETIERKIYSKFPCQNATSFLIFKEGNKTQKLLHALKYENKPKLASFLGVLFSRDLMKRNFFLDIDAIIPVPLHPKKQEQRGYNQSQYLALGMSKASNVLVKTDWLIRGINTETQTKKSRTERLENLKNAFHVNETHDMTGKHILLVDDVITTGSTLEACAKTLLSANVRNISVATIAVAE